jgi:sugar phosphate permease
MDAAALSQQSPPTRVRWIILALACSASWLLYLQRYAWGYVRSSFHRDNPGLSQRELGVLDSAFLVTYAIGQVPSGLLGDRFGPRAMLSVLALVGSLASVSLAWTGGLWGPFGARAAFGLAQAGVYPVLNKMTRTWFPLATRTSAQGAVTALGRVGAACAPVVISGLLLGEFGLSWQNTLVVVGIPGLVLAAAFWLMIRDSPRQHPWTNEAEQCLLGEPSPRVADSAALTSRPKLLLTGATIFSFAMLLLYTFTSTFQDQFFVNRLPTFLERDKGFDSRRMAIYGPLPLLGGAVGGIFAGILNDTLIRGFGSRRWARSLVAFTGKLCAACLVLLSMQMEDGRATIAVLCAARFFSDWSLSTQWAAITDMGGRAAATLFGIVNTVGIIGGVHAGPVFGDLSAAYGERGVFYGVAAMCIVAATCWLFIDCTRRVVAD